MLILFRRLSLCCFFIFAMLAIRSASAAEAATCPTGDSYTVTGAVKLSPECHYDGTIRIVDSNSLLDCQGALIDGEKKRQSGIEIDSGGKPLRNVEIRNCVVVNAHGEGVMIGWSAPDSTKAKSFDREMLYKLTPTQVRLVNVTVENAGGVGIYVDDYVTNTVIDHCKVTGSGSVGIYIEHSSKSTVVENSDISDNGIKQRREGIAIDSSENNVITQTKLNGNYGGGVYIYKNCSEHLAEDPKQVIRWQSADHNTISNNNISGGKAGIWVASRQSLDLQSMQCGNGYYADGKYTLDSAKFNSVLNNKISDVKYGVIVEDDHNIIVNNFFNNIEMIGVKVGSIPRDQFLRQPVRDVRVMGNSFNSVKNVFAKVGDAQVSLKNQ